MVADQQVAKIVWAIDVLSGRVSGATRDEIGFLALMGEVELDRALCRGVVNGWVQKVMVTPITERTGVRSGDWVFQLTSMCSDDATARPHASMTAA